MKSSPGDDFLNKEVWWCFVSRVLKRKYTFWKENILENISDRTFLWEFMTIFKFSFLKPIQIIHIFQQTSWPFHWLKSKIKFTRITLILLEFISIYLNSVKLIIQKFAFSSVWRYQKSFACIFDTVYKYNSLYRSVNNK